MEQQRQHARFDFKTDVELELPSATAQGKTVNISQGGALINTSTTIPFGARLILHIRLPGVPTTCRMPCIVRWSKENEAVGVQFETIRAIEVWAINKLKHS